MNCLREIIFIYLYRLFSLLWTFKKTSQPPYYFYIFGLICLIINSVGIVVRWLNFPILIFWNPLLTIKFFNWTDFSISYINHIFLVVVSSIVGVVITVSIVGLLVLTFLNV
jgi:hypothetical protein